MSNDDKMGNLNIDQAKIEIPSGRWRNGICDCCTYGPCHAQCWLTFCCAPLALGQIMTRMNETVWGDASTTRNPQGCFRPFRVMIGIAVLIYFLNTIAISRSMANPNQQQRLGFLNVVSLVLSIYLVTVHTKTRNRIRRTYNIGSDNGDHCIGDCCCACWCAGCSICQMASHTADYRNTHRAKCCTETGLDGDVEQPTQPFVTGTSDHVI
jgi:Cys-rich protein (TIGR01571 family)